MKANFGVLLVGAQELDGWGLTADLAQYQATSDRINSLHAAQEGIDASIATCREGQDLTLHHLCTACVTSPWDEDARAFSCTEISSGTAMDC